MQNTFRYGTILAALIVVAWLITGTAVAGSLDRTAGKTYLTGPTPNPPAHCRPLVANPGLPVMPTGFVPMPVNCAPLAVAPPLKRPEPALLLGYLYGDKGTQIALEYSGDDQRVLRKTKCDVDLQGLWAEFVFPIVLTYKEDFILSVGHLFPFQNRATQRYSLIESGETDRDWHHDMRWWEVTTAWTKRVGRHFEGVVGFRWSSLVIEFDRPEGRQPLANGEDSSRLNANAYLPFIGVRWESSSRQQGRFSAEVIGFPFFPGDIEHTESLTVNGQNVITKYAPGGEYRTGYFLEAKAEYEVCRGAWNFGAFVRFNAAHTERERHLRVNDVLSDANISFDRSYWICGGKIGFSL